MNDSYEVCLKSVCCLFLYISQEIMIDSVNLYQVLPICFLEQSLIAFFMDTLRSWVDHLPQHGKHVMPSCIQTD